MHRLLALATTIGPDGGNNTPFSPATHFQTFGSLVSVIVSNAIVLAGVVAFIFVIIGGFGIIAGAGGDPKKIEQGRNTLTMAILGLVIVTFSLWFIQVIGKFLGIQSFLGI